MVSSTSLVSDSEIAPSELVDALNTLGVCFLSGGSGVSRSFPPAALLAALASSTESRLRMALIPLLLAHPEFAEMIGEVEESLPARGAVVLRCYYTAAYWLRAKYHKRLEAVCGLQPALPDLFSEQTGLADQTAPDGALGVLALYQQKLTGLSLNWLGTYEHAAQSWLRFTEHEKQWQKSHPRKSTYS